jgi:transmembrane sensor
MNEEYERLLVQYLSGSATPEERSRLDEWRRTDEANEKTFQEFSKIFAIRDDQVPPFNAAEEWHRLEQRLQFVEEEPASEHVLFLYAKIAASVALLVASFFLVRNLIHDKPVKIASGDEVRHVKLDDGTTVWLKPNSWLEYTSAYGEKDRHVELKGHGFFEVAPDPAMPFVISADEATIQVVGTSFMVYADPATEMTAVEVMSGIVEFGGIKSAERVRLTRGHRAEFVNTTGALASKAIAVDNILAWKDKRLVFRKNPMEEVINVVELYFNVDIVVENPGLLSCRFTSTFEDPSITEVLEALSVSMNVDVVQNGDEYTLQGGGCQ